MTVYSSLHEILSSICVFISLGPEYQEIFYNPLLSYWINGHIAANDLRARKHCLAVHFDHALGANPSPAGKIVCETAVKLFIDILENRADA